MHKENDGHECSDCADTTRTQSSESRGELSTDVETKIRHAAARSTGGGSRNSLHVCGNAEEKNTDHEDDPSAAGDNTQGSDDDDDDELFADEDGDGTWLDRTNCALGAIGGDLPEDLTHLCLTNNRIERIENLDRCKRLRRLILRQNAISAIEGLEALTELVELDMYINKVTHIADGAFRCNRKLEKLDLSFNNLRKLTGLPIEFLSNLRELFLIANKIKVIENLHSMPHLHFLELGDNRVRVLQNLDQIPSLTSLWLGRNKVERIENLHNLPNLQILSLQSNRIRVIENLEHLKRLEELYLSHNGIESMKGLETLVQLRVLDLGTNSISHIEGISKLVYLVEFWVNDNQLESFDELAEQLAGAKGLQTAYLEGNPLSRDEQYAAKALAALPPSLQQLDALPVDHVRAHMRQ